ncbi:MAG: RNA polymerase sigma factor (sigma-70 family), partial [Psychroserpens sp.]
GSLFNSLEFSQAPIETETIKQDTYNALKQHIKDLPDSQREVLVMRHYMQMSFQDIAEATNVSINTALGRMRYALINLRKKLKTTNNAYDQNFYRE